MASGSGVNGPSWRVQRPPAKRIVVAVRGAFSCTPMRILPARRLRLRQASSSAVAQATSCNGRVSRVIGSPPNVKTYSIVYAAPQSLWSVGGRRFSQRQFAGHRRKVGLRRPRLRVTLEGAEDLSPRIRESRQRGLREVVGPLALLEEDFRGLALCSVQLPGRGRPRPVWGPAYVVEERPHDKMGRLKLIDAELEP